MKLCYPNPDNPNKTESEMLKIPLGQGHFSRGLAHTREIGKENFDKEVNKSNKFFKTLSEKYDKYLKIPTTIGIDYLQKSGWATMESCSKIFECIPSEELQQLLRGFSQGHNKNNKENNKNLSNYIQEFLAKNQQEKSKEVPNELNKNENSQKEISKDGQNLIGKFSKEQMAQLREVVNEVVKKILVKTEQKIIESLHNINQNLQ